MAAPLTTPDICHHPGQTTHQSSQSPGLVWSLKLETWPGVMILSLYCKLWQDVLSHNPTLSHHISSSLYRYLLVDAVSKKRSWKKLCWANIEIFSLFSKSINISDEWCGWLLIVFTLSQLIALVGCRENYEKSYIIRYLIMKFLSFKHYHSCHFYLVVWQSSCKCKWHSNKSEYF